jgi:hypothetical protein
VATVPRSAKKKEEMMLDESIVLVGWLLVYAIPVGILAYWLEKKLQDTGGSDDN